MPDVAEAFDPLNPFVTANFSTTVTLFDGGALANLDIYFSRGEAWEYHALIGNEQLGSGQLFFDDAGALTHHERFEPLAVRDAAGGVWPIQLELGTALDEGGDGRDGMTANDEPFTVAYLDVDGAPSSLGYTCPPTLSGAPPSSSAVQCAASATTRLSLSANLRPDIDSRLDTRLFAYDATGAAVAFFVRFRKLGDLRWSYWVELAGEVAQEVGRGTLRFNADGSLAHHAPSRELRLTALDGSSSTIQLDLGVGTEDAGNGVDGITSFPQETWVRRVGHDGHPGLLGACPSVFSDGSDWGVPAAFALEDYSAMLVRPPQLPGRMTTLLGVNACLDPTTPLLGDDDTFDLNHPLEGSDQSFAVQLLDAELKPHQVSLYLRHVGSRRWRARVLTLDASAPHELGTVQLDFSQDGWLEHVGGSSELRFPLSSGRPGPAVPLDFGRPLDQPGEHPSRTVTWCPDHAFGSLQANGVVPEQP